MFDGPVYLETFIKVKSGWADNEGGTSCVWVRMTQGRRCRPTLIRATRAGRAGASCIEKVFLGPRRSGAEDRCAARAPAARVRLPANTGSRNNPRSSSIGYPYRETSLIVDVLSRDHGRLSLVAKGAKRPHSALRGVLQTFQPLSLSWSGRSEMRTLTAAEWVGGMLPLAGDALLCGFYV